MASLGIAIMAVPERRQIVDQLLAKLKLSAQYVVWDKNHDGHLPTWWRAVQQASSTKPSHVLILEDDAVASNDLIAAVNQLINIYPDRVYSLYSNLRSVDKARAEGIKLLANYRMQSDVAMVYPCAWLDELQADYLKRAQEFEGMGADDMRLKLRPNLTVWSTVPSLVQHGQPYDSTLGHKNPRQIARWFIGSNKSALSIDWSRP